MREEIELLERLVDELLAGILEVLQSGEILSDEFQGAIADQLEWATSRIDQLRAEEEQQPQQQQPLPQIPGQQPISPIIPIPPTPPINTPPLEEAPFPSSNVNSFKYNPATQQLWIKFHGSESADSGPIYMYNNIPKNTYDIFSQGRVAPKTSGQNQYHRWIRGVTPSLGASLYALIRNGGYPYQRIS